MFKVTTTNDFRKFKKGDLFDFFMPITVIVGDNGCGKSSLVHAIRGKYDFENPSLFKSDFIKLSSNIEIETDINSFMFLDSVKDDGGNLNNSYDAVTFVSNGGFQTKNLSHGETQLYYISELVNKIIKFREKSDEKIMLVLDEFDKGFSLTNQAKVINILYNLNKKYNCNIICISHNYLLIEEIGVVYDLEMRNVSLSKEYLSKFKK